VDVFFTAVHNAINENVLFLIFIQKLHSIIEEDTCFLNSCISMMPSNEVLSKAFAQLSLQ
jgi:hypothetical protein